MASHTAAATPPVLSRSPVPIGPGRWQRGAPRDVVRAYATAKIGAGWQAWQAHLAKRRLHWPRPVPGTSTPLSWALDTLGQRRAESLAKRLAAIQSPTRGAATTKQKQLAAWLDAATTAAGTPEFALECLAWAWTLIPLAAECSERIWWNALHRLTSIAADDPSAELEPLARQLLHGELPLTLAWLFPEVADCWRWPNRVGAPTKDCWRTSWIRTACRCGDTCPRCERWWLAGRVHAPWDASCAAAGAAARRSASMPRRSNTCCGWPGPMGSRPLNCPRGSLGTTIS